MRYFKIDFSNGKYVLTFDESMVKALETAVMLNNTRPIRCIEISLEEYKAIQRYKAL